MANRDHRRDAAAQRIAHHVAPVDPEVLDQRRDVVGHEPDVERAVDVGRPAVALEVDGDHLAVGRQRGQDRAEHLARAEAPVEQDERAAGPLCFEVQVDSVDLGVLAGSLGLAGPLIDCHGGAPLGVVLLAPFHQTEEIGGFHRPNPRRGRGTQHLP